MRVELRPQVRMGASQFLEAVEELMSPSCRVEGAAEEGEAAAAVTVVVTELLVYCCSSSAMVSGCTTTGVSR